jgi:membrane protein required for colicin V production
MQLYDLIMIAVLVGTTAFGTIKGLAWQLAAIGSLVASYFVALRFSPVVAPIFGDHVPWNRFAAMALLYLFTGAAIWYLFRFVSDFMNRLKLREFDHQLGFLFGAAKGVALCVVVTFFAVTLSQQARTHVLESRSGHYIAVLLAQADAIMPAELHEVLDPYLHQLEQQLQPATGAEEHKTATGQGGAAEPFPPPAERDQFGRGRDAGRPAGAPFAG